MRVRCVRAAVAFSLLALLSCDRPGRHSPTKPAVDAADAPPAPVLAECPTQRICPHVKSVEQMTGVDLGYGALIHVGNAVMTPQGPAVSWEAVPKDPQNGTRHIGVALLSESKVASVVQQVPPYDVVIANPPLLFAREGELDFVIPAGAYDQIVRVPLDTFVPSEPTFAPISGPPGDPPAVLGVGQALVALINGGPRLLFVDASLSERLVDFPLDVGLSPTLTRTCNGIVAAGATYGGVRAAAFDTLGSQIGPVIDAELATGLYPRRADVWDGASVVLARKDEVVELDNNGFLKQTTPVDTFTAFGTEDGLLVAWSSLMLVQRGTGTVLETYPDTYWAGDAIAAQDHTVYFASGATTGGIYWGRVTCTD